MKKILNSAVVFFSLLLALQVLGAPKKTNICIENFQRYAALNSKVGTQPVAVFMGDSITDNWARMSPKFFADNNYLGRGISGQVTCQMLARFRPDVLELKPKIAMILAGTNDIAQNQGPIPVDNIVGNIISMCELAKLHGIKPVICSVLPVYRYAWRKNIEAVSLISELNGKLKAYAEKTPGVVYLDYFSKLADSRKCLSEADSKDGCHPNLDCYRNKIEPMAKACIEEILKSEASK